MSRSQWHKSRLARPETAQSLLPITINANRSISFLCIVLAMVWSNSKIVIKIKVIFILKWAVWTQMGSRCIALLFHLGVRKSGRSTSQPGHFTPRKKTGYPLYKRLGGPRAGVEGCGKSRHYRDWIPGPSSP